MCIWRTRLSVCAAIVKSVRRCLYPREVALASSIPYLLIDAILFEAIARFFPPHFPARSVGRPRSPQVPFEGATTVDRRLRLSRPSRYIAQVRYTFCIPFLGIVFASGRIRVRDNFPWTKRESIVRGLVVFGLNL